MPRCSQAVSCRKCQTERLQHCALVGWWGPMGAVPPPRSPLRRGRGCARELAALLHPQCCAAADALQPHPSDKWLCRSPVTTDHPSPRARCPADGQRVGQGTLGSPGCVRGGWDPGAHGDGALSPQGAVLSQLVRASAHLDGVLLEAVTVLGVTSPPRQVLANGALVGDFSYRSDTQASARPHRGRGWQWRGAAGRRLGGNPGLSRGAGGV